MFKKKRNAEMQKSAAAESERIIGILRQAGIISEAVTVYGLGEPVTTYKTDLVSREEARKDAERAATRAVTAYKDALREEEWARKTREIDERDLNRRIAKGANEAIDQYVAQQETLKREAVGSAHVTLVDAGGVALGSAELAPESTVPVGVAASALSAREVSLLIDERIAAAHERKTVALNAIYAEKKRRRELDSEDAAEPTTEAAK